MLNLEIRPNSGFVAPIKMTFDMENVLYVYPCVKNCILIGDGVWIWDPIKSRTWTWSDLRFFVPQWRHRSRWLTLLKWSRCDLDWGFFLVKAESCTDFASSCTEWLLARFWQSCVAFFRTTDYVPHRSTFTPRTSRRQFADDAFTVAAPSA